MKDGHAEARRGAASQAAAVFALVAPTSYAALRLYEIARTGAIDPSLILLSSHVGYLWRIVIASWWAATCAFIAYGRAQTQPMWNLGRWVRASLVIAALLIVVSFAFP
jgi:hypothetical protein